MKIVVDLKKAKQNLKENGQSQWLETLVRLSNKEINLQKYFEEIDKLQHENNIIACENHHKDCITVDDEELEPFTFKFRTNGLRGHEEEIVAKYIVKMIQLDNPHIPLVYSAGYNRLIFTTPSYINAVEKKLQIFLSDKKLKLVESDYSNFMN